MVKIPIRVQSLDKSWRRIDWDEDIGICCPNWRACGEKGLSLQWHIDFRKDENDNNLRCFQCNTIFARLVVE